MTAHGAPHSDRGMSPAPTRGRKPIAVAPSSVREVAAQVDPHEPDLIRMGLPLIAVLAVVGAIIGDPGGWWKVGLLLVATAGLLAWARWTVPPILLGIWIILPTTVSQTGGNLEPGLFLISLLALVITGWYPMSLPSALVTAAALLTPLTVTLVIREDEIAWGIWTFGIAFPAFMGWASRRQEVLRERLAKAQRELAEQTVLEERRRIARDVHDLVGHGLAAMMLHVTGARHVLHRDPQAADEALAAIEDAGRRSMQELRRTVAMLREGDSALAATPPELGQVEDLVRAARGAGLRVDYTLTGDPQGVDHAVGLTLYRIVQESLANASRHAPHANTRVRTTVDGAAVTVEVRTTGPVMNGNGADPDRPRYGVRGMQERADVVGGTLIAGPEPDGWLVRCAVPR